MRTIKRNSIQANEDVTDVLCLKGQVTYTNTTVACPSV